MAAAISAARRGASVALCEKMPKLGRKVLASGNGRCNLTNDTLDPSSYNPASRALAESVFSRFGTPCIRDFFAQIGLRTYSEDGRVFPVTNQSSSVLKVLELELARLSVDVLFNTDVTGIASAGGGFAITQKSGRRLSGRRVIVACGGTSYPAFGADGSAYTLAASFGHTIVEPVPVAVPLVVKDGLCHSLQGQKITAAAAAIIGGKALTRCAGDVLFTKYGLSGTAILDISEEVSIAINRNRGRGIRVSVDMVPFMEQGALEAEIAGRIRRSFAPEDLVAGILPNKFGPALKDLMRSRDPAKIAGTLKDRRFDVHGTRGWNEADFTAGGVAVGEVDEASLESTRRKGLYFAGEILDVNGKRGGYNLAWAWASGFIAGEAAANA